MYQRCLLLPFTANGLSQGDRTPINRRLLLWSKPEFSKEIHVPMSTLIPQFRMMKTYAERSLAVFLQGLVVPGNQ